MRIAECEIRIRKDRGEYSIAGLIIGRPLVIATVGPGTAFEIAGKGKANFRPMSEAIQLVSRSRELQSSRTIMPNPLARSE